MTDLSDNEYPSVPFSIFYQINFKYCIFNRMWHICIFPLILVWYFTSIDISISLEAWFSYITKIYLACWLFFLMYYSYLLFNFNDYPNGMVTLFNLLVMGNWQVWMQVYFFHKKTLLFRCIYWHIIILICHQAPRHCLTTYALRKYSLHFISASEVWGHERVSEKYLLHFILAFEVWGHERISEKYYLEWKEECKVFQQWPYMISNIGSRPVSTLGLGTFPFFPLYYSFVVHGFYITVQ